MKTIHDLSWNENSFPDKLLLFKLSRRNNLEKIRSENPIEQAAGYSALASTYYTICATAFAHTKAIMSAETPPSQRIVGAVLWPVSWAPLGAWCFYRMYPLSRKAIDMYGGFENAPANVCDVHQSIARRRGKLDEALKCINEALGKNWVDAHTRALLLVGRADVFWRLNDWTGAYYAAREAAWTAIQVESYNPEQAIRIYRNCADILRRIKSNPALEKVCRQKAVQLAEGLGTKDQLLKMS